MIQLYCGNGKGKTTAAIGAAVRAAGSGMQVLFTQFFKNGDSSEIYALKQVQGVYCMFPKEKYILFETLDEPVKAKLSQSYHSVLEQMIHDAAEYDMLVLDEAISAYNLGLLDKEKFYAFLQSEKQNREIILTGRNPDDTLLALADYVSEICMVKHPFEQGAMARKGIEF